MFENFPQFSLPDYVKGAILGAIVIPFILAGIRRFIRYWKNTRPAMKLLEGLTKNDERCVFWLRDAYQKPGSGLLEVSEAGAGVVPNVNKWWAEVDAKAVADVLNVLGSQGKSKNIEFHLLSQNRFDWDANLICIGAQFPQANLIFDNCKNVFFKIDNDDIFDVQKASAIQRDINYGYGIIIKARNPYKTSGEGTVFLIGGFGALGTESAGYYFRNNFVKLGKRFGKNCFGVLVRAKTTAGPQSVERMFEYDRVEVKVKK